jgi:hypothetical protein
MENWKMKKLFFTALYLFVCCTFLPAAEKVIIERAADSEIQSIVVEKDILIIRSRGKTYNFKFSELLKDKSIQISKTKKISPKNLKEAFTINGQWCFFRLSKNNNRLKRIKELKYDVFHDGDFFQKVLFNEKYYARSLDKKIYEPHWEVKKDFSSHLIPAKIYIKYLDNNIELFKKALQKLELKIPEVANVIKADREKYILFLKNNSLTTVTEPNGNVTTQQSSGGLPSAKLRRQLRLYYKNIKTQEKNLKYTTRRLRCLKNKLNYTLQLKLKSEASYKKYAYASK